MTPNSEGGEALFAPRAGRSIDQTLALTTRHGRTYWFSWPAMSLPVLKRKDGSSLGKHPGPRHPIWADLEFWHGQGRRIDEHGNCIWDAHAPQQEAAIRKAEGGGV